MKMQGNKTPSLSNSPEFNIQVIFNLLQSCQLRGQIHLLLKAMLSFPRAPGSSSFRVVSRPDVLCVAVFYFTETGSRWASPFGLKFAMLLPQPPNCYHYRRVSPPLLHIVVAFLSLCSKLLP